MYRNQLLQLFHGAFRVTVLWLCLTIPLLAQRDSGAFLLTESERFTETNPLISADAATLYFTRLDHPRNQGSDNLGDIWIKQRNISGEWSRALNAGSPINSFADDRLIGLSPDGNRLAVLRNGPIPFVDLLHRGSRSWRIINSFPLDETPEDAHFDLESGRLYFSQTSADGQSDLFVRTAVPANASWSEVTALYAINSPLDEGSPYLTYDGRHLYFQRGGDWFVSDWRPSDNTFGVARELNLHISSNYAAISIPVVSPDHFFGADADRHILSAWLPPAARPSTSRLLTGTVNSASAPGTRLQAPRIRLLIEGQERIVYPDGTGKYTVVIPAVEDGRIIAEASGYFAPSRTLAVREELDGGVATKDGSSFSNEYYQRERRISELHQRIAVAEADLATLQRQRTALSQKMREEQLSAGRQLLDGFGDPEWEKLRDRLQTAQQNLRDTVPPKPTTPQTTKGPIDFDELEAMKARYRSLQDEALQLKGASTYQWRGDNPAALQKQVEKTVIEQLIPGVSREIAQRAWRDQPIDSLTMAEGIRNGLFAAPSPAVYERESWENELIRDLVPEAASKVQARLETTITEGLAEEQSLRADYRRLSTDLAQYRDSLQRQVALQFAEEEIVNSPARQFTEKGLGAASPQTAYQKVTTPNLELVPLLPGQKIVLERIQFSPNLAEIKSSSREELDRLVELLRANPQLVIEIGAHTNDQLSYLQAQDLSEERARVVMQYLMDANIALSRLRHRGYGRRYPIADNTTPAGRARNQRIEVTILSTAAPK